MSDSFRINRASALRFALALLLAVSAHGQDTPAPTPPPTPVPAPETPPAQPPTTPAPAESPAPTPEPSKPLPGLLDPIQNMDLNSPPPANPPVVPEPLLPEVPPPSKLPPPPEPSSPPKKAAGEETRQQIRLREAKSRALRDPAVQAWMDRAERARTDQEKRAALREYYLTLYRNMRRSDPDLKPQIDQLELIKLNSLRMWRTNPSEGADRLPLLAPKPSPTPRRRGGQ